MSVDGFKVSANCPFQREFSYSKRTEKNGRDQLKGFRLIEVSVERERVECILIGSQFSVLNSKYR